MEKPQERVGYPRRVFVRLILATPWTKGCEGGETVADRRLTCTRTQQMLAVWKNRRRQQGRGKERGNLRDLGGGVSQKLSNQNGQSNIPTTKEKMKKKKGEGGNGRQKGKAGRKVSAQ